MNSKLRTKLATYMYMITSAQLYQHLTKVAGWMNDPDMPEEEKARLTKEYQDGVAAFSTQTLEKMAEFINFWATEDLFEFDKVIGMFANTLFSTYTNDTLYQILHSSPIAYGLEDRYRDKIKLFLTKYYIDNYFDRIKAYDMNGFDEVSQLPKDYLRKAKFEIVNKIIKDFEAGHILLVVDELKYLRLASSFDNKFIERLAKKLSPAIYANIMPHDEERYAYEPSNAEVAMNTFNRQDKLDMYDIARILLIKDDLTPKYFNEILQKADEKGKEYLKGFLYFDMEKGDYFMLDEEMKPLNIELKNIPFPPKFIMVANRDEMGNSKEKMKWSEIFADFKRPWNEYIRWSNE